MTEEAGRHTELSRLDAASAGGARLFYVHGPAGEGKTTLVRRWLERTRAPYRKVGPAEVGSRPRGLVWIDDWTRAHEPGLLDALRDEPTLRVIVCAREAPSLTLRTAVADSLVLALEPLPADEVRRWLAHLPPEEIKEQLLFTHGHALSLRVLARADAREPLERRRLLGQLLETFVGDALSTDDRIAVEALAPLRFVSEAQLQRATGASATSAYELIERFRRLSFVRAEPLGLSLHPTLREILLEDLAWRAPERTRALVAGELPVLRAELARGGALRERAVEILLDLIARAPGAWVRRAALIPPAVQATPSDHSQVVELVRHHEGDESAAICARWLAAYPERCMIARDEAGHLCAVALRALIDTRAVPPLDDPIAVRVLEALAGKAPFALVNRFLVGRMSYQTLGPELMPVMAALIRDTFLTSHQAHVTVVRDVGAFPSAMSSGVLPVLPGTRTPIGAHVYVGLGSAIASDVEVTQGFLGFLASQWGIPLPPADDAAVPSGLERLVHAAILALDDPLSLARTPLAKRLGVGGIRLQTLLRAAIDQVDKMPDGERIQRALLAPMRTGGTQEDAAASVAMSLATYKRFRKRGEQRVSEILWSARSMLRDP